jgi:hypothetical protein
MVLKITKRCFSKILVAATFDAKNPRLSDSEKGNLVALLQILESAYDEDIWTNLGVVTLQTGGNLKHSTNLTYPNLFFLKAFLFLTSTLILVLLLLGQPLTSWAGP